MMISIEYNQKPVKLFRPKCSNRNDGNNNSCKGSKPVNILLYKNCMCPAEG